MGLPPYLYERPDRVVARLLGAAPPLGELLGDAQYLERAVDALARLARGEAGLPEGESLSDTVVLYHVMLAVAARTGRSRIIRALVKASGDDARERLRRSGPGAIERYARMLGIPLEQSEISIPWLAGPRGVTRLPLPYRVALGQYLRLASGAGGILALSNSFVRDGYVYLDLDRARELVALAVERRVEALMDRYSRMELPSQVDEAAVRAAARIEESSRALSLDTLPPCIRRIVEEGARSDEEAYMLVSFLSSVKPPREDIEDLLVRSGLAGARSAGNIADALLTLPSAPPYRCDSPRGRRACPEGCGRGVLREYYSRLRRRRRAQD